MTSVSYEQLLKIISYIPKTNTRCSSTKDFIEAYLSQNWNEQTMKKFPPMSDYSDYFGARTHWITHEYRKKYICFNTINKINGFLSKYGYLSVGLEFFPKNSTHEYNLDHDFVVCQTDQGQVVCDSYLNTRPVEIRPFNLQETLTSLITTPTIENWNRIWKSSCKGKIGDVYRLKTIEVSYYDINREETNYVNNVRSKIKIDETAHLFLSMISSSVEWTFPSS